MACLDVGSLAWRNRRGFRSLSQAVSGEEGESSCTPNRLSRGLTIWRISNADPNSDVQHRYPPSQSGASPGECPMHSTASRDRSDPSRFTLNPLGGDVIRVPIGVGVGELRQT